MSCTMCHLTVDASVFTNLLLRNTQLAFGHCYFVLSNRFAMSVLNHSCDDQPECPLCMEAFEVDDLNFFPCTCGYQICRFCWHRIRTDENGLCPACRKPYPEDPADFKPLSREEVAKLKAEKRHKHQQKKNKITEDRKVLNNMRVLQKNLVFVVGLPNRISEAEVICQKLFFFLLILSAKE